jgi:hypothetical protein
MTMVPLAPVRFGAKALALRFRLEAMMRRRSLPDLLQALTPSPPRAARGREVVYRTAPLAALRASLSATEDILARFPLAPDTCLYRALTRYAILRSAGYPARFVMGVRPGAGEIVGHAWVELAGEPFDEDLEPDLVVTYAYPETPERNWGGS